MVLDKVSYILQPSLKKKLIKLMVKVFNCYVHK